MKHLLSKELVASINLETRKLVAEAVDAGVDPQLGVIMVGAHPASVRYVGIKSRQAKENGIILSLYQMDDDVSFEQIEEAVRFLDADTDVHGLIIQLPLPERFTAQQTDHLIGLISPAKDVDGLRGDWKTLAYTKYGLESLLAPAPLALPPMVESVTSLLDYYEIDLAGKRIVLVGEGRLVGSPLRSYLEALGMDVVTVDEETEKIFDVTRTADILIAGTGQDELITYEWIKEGAVVIDCAADIHTDSVEQVASAVAPSRGGVGPLTVAWLLHNSAQAALREVTHE